MMDIGGVTNFMFKLSQVI